MRTGNKMEVNWLSYTGKSIFEKYGSCNCGHAYRGWFEKISISDFEAILKSRDRSKAGYSVPAHGLYLEKVNYPKHIFAA